MNWRKVIDLAQDMNPFGVGASGQNVKWAYTKCTCCQLKFETKFVSGIPTPAICKPCQEHIPAKDESIETLNSRLLSHQVLYLNWIRDITEKMHDTWGNNKALKEQTRAALSSRDRWREVLERVSALHGETLEGKTCQCGHKWPCETWQALHSNQGISRHIDPGLPPQLH